MASSTSSSSMENTFYIICSLSVTSLYRRVNTFFETAALTSASYISLIFTSTEIPYSHSSAFLIRRATALRYFSETFSYSELARSLILQSQTPLYEVYTFAFNSFFVSKKTYAIMFPTSINAYISTHPVRGFTGRS